MYCWLTITILGFHRCKQCNSDRFPKLRPNLRTITKKLFATIATMSETKASKTVLEHYLMDFFHQDITPEQMKLLLAKQVTSKLTQNQKSMDHEDARSVEVLRVTLPDLAFVDKDTSRRDVQLVHAAGYFDSKHKLESLDGTQTTVGHMLSKQTPKKLLSVVEDMYLNLDDTNTHMDKETASHMDTDEPLPKTDKKLVALVQHINQNNVFYKSEIGKTLSSTTLVLSHKNVHSRAHQHPTGFWNVAWCGSKLYLVWDTLEAEQKRIFVRNDTSIRTKQLTLTHFLFLESSRIILLSHDADNMIIVPSRFSHDVITVDVPESCACYAGLVGFWMPMTRKSGTLLFEITYRYRAKCILYIFSEQVMRKVLSGTNPPAMVCTISLFMCCIIYLNVCRVWRFLTKTTWKSFSRPLQNKAAVFGDKSRFKNWSLLHIVLFSNSTKFGLCAKHVSNRNIDRHGMGQYARNISAFCHHKKSTQCGGCVTINRHCV